MTVSKFNADYLKFTHKLNHSCVSRPFSDLLLILSCIFSVVPDEGLECWQELYILGRSWTQIFVPLETWDYRNCAQPKLSSCFFILLPCGMYTCAKDSRREEVQCMKVTSLCFIYLRDPDSLSHGYLGMSEL